jgi:acetyl-CoA carboxylase carboxyl transferase subunit alpha
MKRTYLEFEKPVETLEAKIESLKKAHDDHPTIDVNKELNSLQEKLEVMQHKIFDNLTAWQISQVSRHPQRPYTQDYIQAIFKNFKELHGDRAYSDDPAIIGGLAEFEGQSVMVIGHQKGRDIKERQHRNFGMPRPEGYRKALRLFKLAEKFSLPIITLIDTPGAYPGIGAEERGQSDGALALGVSDRLSMLEFSTYSVISPEGCASILWKKAEMAEVAADTLGITSTKLKKLGLVDEIVSEPLGGAHRDYKVTMKNVKQTLKDQLIQLKATSIDELLENRYKRLTSFGQHSHSEK